MNHVALNDAPGRNIVTTWNWNPSGFYNTVSNQHAFPRRNGSVHHFPCVLVPRSRYPTANVFVMETALALIPGHDIVPVVMGVRTELGNSLQAHRHASAFQFTCQGVGNRAECCQWISNPGQMGRYGLSLARLPRPPQLVTAKHSVCLVELTGWRRPLRVDMALRDVLHCEAPRHRGEPCGFIETPTPHARQYASWPCTSWRRCAIS
jgi:hypothetical protein